MPDVKDIDLRDWFAGAALIGMLSRPPQPYSPEITTTEDPAYSLAIRAYQHADAMLRARARDQEPPQADAP